MATPRGGSLRTRLVGIWTHDFWIHTWMLYTIRPSHLFSVKQCIPAWGLLTPWDPWEYFRGQWDSWEYFIVFQMSIGVSGNSNILNVLPTNCVKLNKNIIPWFGITGSGKTFFLIGGPQSKKRLGSTGPKFWKAERFYRLISWNWTKILRGGTVCRIESAKLQKTRTLTFNGAWC